MLAGGQAMHGIDQPVFLVGSERSGTTLMRLMLDHHPEIAFNLESEFLVTRIRDDCCYPDITAYIDWLEHDRVFQHSHFKITDGLGYAALVNDFLEQKRNRDGKPYVGATVHYQFGKLACVWPHAKFIYLCRDGRDVANSVVQMGWAGNVYVAADLWLEAEREWAEFRPRLAGGQWIEVRYEDLIADPRGTLGTICDFIGVGYDDRMFGYVEDSSYGLPDARFMYQWKSRMSERDIRLAEAKLAAGLLSRGYELSGLPELTHQSVI
jgi:hypothetical protein